MSKTKIIRHPENAFSIEVFDWQIKAINELADNEKFSDKQRFAAGALLNLFDEHTTNPFINEKLREFVLSREVPEDIEELLADGWLPYSTQYLTDCLMGLYSINIVLEGVQILRDVNFVSYTPPEKLKDFFPGKITWIQLQLDAIHEWIEKNNQPKERRFGGGSRFVEAEEKVAKERTPQTLAAAMEMFSELGARSQAWAINRLIDAVCKYHKHTHRKTDKYVYDPTRRGLIKRRLVEGRSIGLCAQAVIGNLKSDWHQGRHQDNDISDTTQKARIYDDIEHIFNTAPRFEKHLGYAERADIDEEAALEDFLAVQNGQESRFAKPTTKTSQNGSTAQTKANQTALADIPKAYRDFARAHIVPFVVVGQTNELILSNIFRNPSTTEAAQPITDDEVLASAITTIISQTWRNGENIEPEMTEKITEFTRAFIKRKYGVIEENEK